jgi:serine/threonine protein kinase
VIRGEKYSESADVYSFGIIMWEVATRKQPYAGRNFMAVTMDVLEGRRPKIPTDLPHTFMKIIKKYVHPLPLSLHLSPQWQVFTHTSLPDRSAWHGVASKRPTMERVIETLEALESNNGAALPVGGV